MTNTLLHALVCVCARAKGWPDAHTFGENKGEGERGSGWRVLADTGHAFIDPSVEI